MKFAKTKVVLVALAALAVLPASAAAESVGWVSTETPSPPFNSCKHPRFQHIQEGVEGDLFGTPKTLKVCAGTYVEQIQINRSLQINGEGTVVVQLPASPARSTTSCDEAIEAATPGQGTVEDAISICGSSRVKISNLTVDAAWPEGTCNDNLYGVNVSGGAELTLGRSKIIAAGAQPINGCQGGVGIQVGAHFTSPEESGSVKLKGDTVSGYQKTGINLDGKAVRGVMSDVTVQGAGPTPATAQDGIQVGFGAVAKIRSSVVNQNEYEGESYAATGILLFGAGSGTEIKSTKVDNNGFGVYYEDEEASAQRSPQVTLKHDEIENSRYVSVLLLQGSAEILSTLMKGGEVGIGLDQFAGQPYGFNGTASKVTIEGMSVHAVQGYSDGEAGDARFELLVSHSKLSGNPAGADLAESVFSESPTLKINEDDDS